MGIIFSMPLLALISTSLSIPLSTSKTLGIRIPFEFPIGTSDVFIVITLYVRMLTLSTYLFLRFITFKYPIEEECERVYAKAKRARTLMMQKLKPRPLSWFD